MERTSLCNPRELKLGKQMVKLFGGRREESLFPIMWAGGFERNEKSCQVINLSGFWRSVVPPHPTLRFSFQIMDVFY